MYLLILIKHVHSSHPTADHSKRGSTIKVQIVHVGMGLTGCTRANKPLTDVAHNLLAIDLRFDVQNDCDGLQKNMLNILLAIL